MRVPVVFVLAGDLPVVMEAAGTCVWLAKKVMRQERQLVGGSNQRRFPRGRSLFKIGRLQIL